MDSEFSVVKKKIPEGNFRLLIETRQKKKNIRLYAFPDSKLNKVLIKA